MKHLIVVVMMAGIVVGCSTTNQVTGRKAEVSDEVLVTVPNTVPSTIYVNDFELDASQMKSEPHLLPGPGIIQRPLDRLRGEPEDPEAYARKLVDLMATTLVHDLSAADVPARRLGANEVAPTDGWVIRGVFTDVEEGNQLRRAIIGFGMGETKLQLNVAVSDIVSNSVEPFYSFDTTKDSGKMPGGIILLNPYVIAAKYVMDRNGLEKDTKKTASKIAEQVGGQLKKLRQGDKNLMQ